MIRVVAVDEETGERRELVGSRVVLIVGDGHEVEMVQAGEAQDTKVAWDLVEQALAEVREEEGEPLSLSPLPRHVPLH